MHNLTCGGFANVIAYEMFVTIYGWEMTLERLEEIDHNFYGSLSCLEDTKNAKAPSSSFHTVHSLSFNTLATYYSFIALLITL